MMPPKFITLILLILGHCRGSCSLRPLIRPNTSEVLISAGDPIDFECIDSSQVLFFITQYSGDGQKIVALEPETREYEANGTYKYTFSRRNAVPTDTGWYGCADHNVTITPEVYNDPEVSWIYFYVQSSNSTFVEENVMKTIREIAGRTAILPCRPTSPDLDVILYNEDAGEEVKIKGNVSYDPRIGFKISNLSVKDNGFFRCLTIRDDEEHETSYHLRVYRNITLDDPIIHNETLKHVIRGQTLRVNCSIDLDSDIPHLLYWEEPHKSPRIKTVLYIIETGLSSQREISELIIENVTEEDEGEYGCFIKNHAEIKSTQAYLKIHDPNKKYITLTPQNPETYYKLPSGGKVKWVVFVDAYPEPELQWLLPSGDPIIPGWSDMPIPKYTVRKVQSSTILTINRLDIPDIGVYKLQATNGDNLETSLNFTLDVLAKPLLMLKEIEGYYSPEQIAEIQCDVEAFPPPHIVWSFLRCPYYPSKKDSSLIELTSITEEPKPNSFLSKARMKIDVSGIINCTACNSEGCDYVSDNIFVSDGNGDFSILEPNELITEGDSISIVCAASIYNYTDNIIWTKVDENGVIMGNGSITIVKEKTPFTYRSILNIQKVRKEDENYYVCSAETTDGHFKRTGYDLLVHDQKPPTFTNSSLKGRDLSIDLGTERYNTIILMCYVDGMPKPNVTWYKDGVMLNKKDQYLFLHKDQELHIKYLLEKDSGKYSCRAANRLRTIEDFINIMIKGKELSKGLISMIVILFIIVVILVVYFTIKVRREKILRKELLETGLMHFEEGALECLNPDLTVDDQAELLPYDKKWEFPRERLKLGKQLGSGAFGVVMKAEAQGICEDETVTTVAVKMVRRTTDPTYVRALASELKIMVHLGKHLNVVNLLGACTKNISKRELLVIVEYCRFGNLHNYLLRHRADFINQIDPTTGKFDPTIGVDLLMRTTSVSSNNRIKYAALSFSRSISANSDTETMHYDTRNISDSMGVTMSPDGCILSNNSSQPGWRSNYRGDYKDHNLKPICTQDLLSWAFQVARGMEYLSQRKVLHGDLAARNILLAEDNIVKICDFGLAKNMYKDDNYKKKGDGPLPIKWMAIESIRDRVFSTQSDIWSFGIVLWEFFTLAETPYPGMEAEKQYQKLIEGYRMEQPVYATSEVYKIMLLCWKAKPVLRPSFTELVDSIGDLLEESVKTHYITLNTPYMDMNTMTLEGKNDYLTMMSAPDHAALSSPTHNYVNSPTTENVPESAYLCMSPTNPRDESGIFSPRPNLEKSRFEFPSVQSDSEDAVELSPMLKSEEDPYLKPINVQERRSEFARQRQAAKKLEIDPSNDRDSGYSNAPRNLHLIDLNEKQTDVDDPQEDQSPTESSSKTKPYPPAIIRTPDNYVNMPKQKSDLRRDMPDSFTNPSYIIMGNSEANQTTV